MHGGLSWVGLCLLAACLCSPCAYPGRGLSRLSAVLRLPGAGVRDGQLDMVRNARLAVLDGGTSRSAQVVHPRH